MRRKDYEPAAAMPQMRKRLPKHRAHVGGNISGPCTGVCAAVGKHGGLNGDRE
jgi:hypothetical protein